MLTAMRKGSDNWFIKIFLGIVVLGFIATGGLVSYSAVQGNNYVANVGETNVSGDDFYSAYTRDVNSYTSRLGMELQPQFLKLLEQSVITRLLNSASIENTGKILNLAIDDAVASKAITSDDSFKSADGTFDKAIFDGIMRRNNLTEKSYVALIKKQEINNQLTFGLTSMDMAPQVYVDILNTYNNQQRIAEFFYVKAKNISINKPPVGDALSSYYKTVQAQFDAPEYRQVDLLIIDPQNLAKNITVDDVTVKERYELSKNSYNSPEKRKISQLVYNTEEQAKAAYDKTQKGTTFAELAVENGVNDQSYQLGEFEKAGLPNKTMANAAFSLNKDEISKPINLGLGFGLLQVSEITETVIKGFDDVKQSIIDQEKQRLAVDKVYELRDEVEDEIAGGATFKEISEKFKIDFTSITSIDQNSKDINDNDQELPSAPALLNGIFTTDESLDNEPVDTANNGLIWYVVNKVTKSRSRTLDEVNNKVIDLWRSTQTNEALLEKVKSLAEKGGDINALSSDIGDIVKISAAVKRNVPSVQLSTSAIEALFAIKQGEYAYVATQVDGENAYILMRLSQIIDPNIEDLDGLNDQVRKQIADELALALIESYIENDKQNYGTSINQTLIDLITSGQP